MSLSQKGGPQTDENDECTLCLNHKGKPYCTARVPFILYTHH